MNSRLEPNKHWRAVLLELRSSLQQELVSSKEDAVPVDLDQEIGRLSRMDAMQQQSMAKARVVRVKNRIQAVGSALRRLDEGDFGECVRCGEDIEDRRLQARPESALCMTCLQGH